MNFVQTTAESRALARITGSVYTPPEVAHALVEFIATILPCDSPKTLEPSVGDGSFVNALAETLPQATLSAIDINSDVISQLKARTWAGSAPHQFEVGDFLRFVLDRFDKSELFDLILGNPPFIRKHSFNDEFKTNLKALASAVHYPLSNLKNSWTAFLLASTSLLNERGVVAFILPYELMTVAYGQAALKFLAGKFHRIDLFVSNEKAFPEIDQDAIIFVGQKCTDTEGGLFVQRVRSMTYLSDRIEHEIKIASDRTLALELNSFLISPSALPLVRSLRSKYSTIGDYCSSAPGIVTAANEFFILTEQKALDLQLSEHTLPILKKSSSATRRPILGVNDFLEHCRVEPCRFVKITGPKESLPPELARYVTTGEEAGYNLRYKCRNRENWYQVPLVERPSAFIFKRSHEYPRLCLNEAGVYITDTAYGLKVKEGFSAKGLCYSFYNSLTLLFAETDGRFYGGGVLELSPKEFRQLPLVYHEPSDAEFEEFLSVHQTANGDISSILDFGDRWLGEDTGLSSTDLGELRSAWKSVRDHRLRHGRLAKAEQSGSSGSEHLT